MAVKRGYDLSKKSKQHTFQFAVKWIVGIFALLLFAGCAYFNTFYNAQNYYRSGLQFMETAGQSGDDKIPRQAADAFGQAIQKSLKVIEKPWEKYRASPGSRFFLTSGQMAFVAASLTSI